MILLERETTVSILGLVLASSLPYLPGVTDSFVFDDVPAVLNNQDMFSSSPWPIIHHDYWGENITSSHSHKSYRPISTLSLWLQMGSDRQSAVVRMKITNIILNCLVSLFAFWLLRLLTQQQHDPGINPNKQKQPPSRQQQQLIKKQLAERCQLRQLVFLSCCQFSLHPLHCEPVVSLVGRADLLYSLVFLAGSCVWLARNTRTRTCCNNISHEITSQQSYPVTSGDLRRGVESKIFDLFSIIQSSSSIFLLALTCLLCKEQGIVLVPFLFTLESFRFNKSLSTRQFIILFTLASAQLGLLVFLRLWRINFTAPVFQKGDNPAAAHPHLLGRLLTFNYILSLNSWLLACPARLAFDWALGCVPLVTSLTDPRVVCVLLLWTLLAGVVVRAAIATWQLQPNRPVPLLPVALLLLVLPFLLSTNLVVYVGFVVAERNLYLSVLGFSLLVNVGSRKLLQINWTRNSGVLARWLIFGSHLLLLTSYIAKSGMRSREWRTEMSLFVSGLTTCPGNGKIYYNIGKKFAEDSKIDSAILFYKEAVRREPDYEHALNNLANLLKSTRRYNDAKGLLQRAVRVNPKFAAAHMNLGIVEQTLGDYEGAEKSYTTALSLRSPYADCEYNLGNLYIKTREYRKAEKHLRTAANLNQTRGLVNLLILLEDLGRGEEALNIGLAGRKQFPQNPEIRFHVANQLGKLNKYEESESEYRAAIALTEKPLYYANLGVLYHRWGRYEAASEAYSAALRLDPNLVSAQNNLQSIQNKIRKYREG